MELKLIEKYDTSELYVGEIYDPQAFILDENGKPTGETKAITTNRFDVATKNADGDFVSVADGTVYSNRITADHLPKFLFSNVETFIQATGCKKKRISKKAAVRAAKEITIERTQCVEI